MIIKNNMMLYTALFAIVITVNCSAQKIFENNNWELVTAGLDFPEGPAWNSNGTLYASNCYGSWIAMYSKGKLDTLVLDSVKSIGKTNGLVLIPDGTIVACDYGLGKILLIKQNGNVKVLIEGYNGAKFNRPNDICSDSKGNLYFTDPSNYGKDKLDGRLFYYDFANKTVTLIADSLAFPNGINISPDEKFIYISESAKNRILRYDIGENGNVTNKTPFIELPGGDPDGIDVDDKGNLYIAHYGTGQLFVISPDGEILEKIRTPGKKPTNIEFGGEDLRTLYLTEVETNSIYKIKTGNKGYKK